jgi:hypothetical protein
MGCRGPQAPSTRTRLGVPACGRSAWWPRRSRCRPRLRHPVHVLGRCPVSGVRRPVRATSVPAWLSTEPVPSVRCGRVSVQVSAVRASRCPLSGVRYRPPVWASDVCALLRPLCPAEVRSWSAAVGRQPYGWDGRGRRGRPLRPCPPGGLPESGASCSTLAQVVLGQPRRRFGPGRRRREVVGQCQLDRVADQDRPGAREDRSWVGAGAQRGSPPAAG